MSGPPATAGAAASRPRLPAGRAAARAGGGAGVAGWGPVDGAAGRVPVLLRAAGRQGRRSWNHDIAAYLFTGGLAAGIRAARRGRAATGRPALRRAGRFTALGAVAASTYFLVNDLGRPERFQHMLRVAKPTSPMSMGTWIFSAFGAAAGVAAVAEAAPLLPDAGVLGLARKVLPPVGTAGQYGAAAAAPALATYTAVLLADTATPSWHAAYPELPFVFAGSALASGAGVGLIAAPAEQAGPARRLAVRGAAMELYGAHRVETTMGLLSEPYRDGQAGKLLRAGRALTAPGWPARCSGGAAGSCRRCPGLSLLAASLADPVRHLRGRAGLGAGPEVHGGAAARTAGAAGGGERRHRRRRRGSQTQGPA